MKKNEVILHGECMIFKSEIPISAKKKVTGKTFKIADSELTGNHHLVETPVGVDILEDKNRIFMNASIPTEVKCVDKERHSTIEIPAGTYEFGTQQEYDPFQARLRNVAD
jgi:hypothetical protein